MSVKSQPSRSRRRKRIARSVLVRLTADQAAAMTQQEAALKVSAASILLTSWERGGSKVGDLVSWRGYNGQVVPAAADAGMLAGLRQLGGLLAHGMRSDAFPAEQATATIMEIRSILDAYRKKIEAFEKSP